VKSSAVMTRSSVCPSVCAAADVLSQPVRGHDVVQSHSEPSAILHLLCACSDNEGGGFGGFYRCAKSEWIRYSIFDNTHVFRFRLLGSKMPIHAPKSGVLEI